MDNEKKLQDVEKSGYLLQDLIVEQSLLIDKQNEKLKEILRIGIYSNSDIEAIILKVLQRAKSMAESQIEHDGIKELPALLLGVRYKDLLNL